MNDLNHQFANYLVEKRIKERQDEAEYQHLIGVKSIALESHPPRKALFHTPRWFHLDELPRAVLRMARTAMKPTAAKRGAS